MAEVVYTSAVTIERQAGAVRHAYLPAESEPVVFGVHGAVAEHYGASPDEIDPRVTTIERVHRMHARHCPVYRSLEGAIDITTEWKSEEGE